MKKSIKLTMILLSGITVFDRALGQNLCVNSRGDTKVASRCPSGYRAVLNLRSTVTEQKLANTPLVTSGSIRPEAVQGSIHIAPKSILGAQIGDGVIETRHIARIHASKIEGLPSFELQRDSVNTEHLRDNAVTSPKIAAGAVGDREVSSISHLKVRWDGWTLPPNSVGERQLLSEAVTSEKIKNETIKNEDIAPNAQIAFSKIALPQGGIPGSSIAAGSIGDREVSSISHEKVRWTGWTLPPNSVGERQLLSEAVTSEKIKNETIKNEDIAPNAQIAFSKIALPQGGIPGSSIAAGSIGAAQLAANAVDSSKILDGTIRREDLADNIINSAKIENGAITDEDIATNARIAFSKIALPQGGIPGSSIAAGSIGAAQLAANAVDSSKILDGTIRREDLADNIINSAKIENGSILSEDLRDGSVTRTKIPNGEIQNSHYAARSITGDKIALNQITSQHIQAEAITNAHLNLSIVRPPFFSFYNLINLPALTAPRDSGVTLNRFYSYSNQSLPNGYASFYANTGSEFPRFLVTTNGWLFGCRRFVLSVQSSTPVGSGYRDFSLVASNRWDNANLMTLKTDNGQDAIVRVSSSTPQGSVEGSFKEQGQDITPWWVALRVYSVANQNQFLYAGSAEVRVTCK
jgi:hypothetical protein